MTNPCLKGMVKIGYARNVEARRKQLVLLLYLQIMRYMLHMKHRGILRIRNYINLLIILIQICVFQKVENSLLWNQKKLMNCWNL